MLRRVAIDVFCRILPSKIPERTSLVGRPCKISWNTANDSGTRPPFAVPRDAGSRRSRMLRRAELASPTWLRSKRVSGIMERPLTRAIEHGYPIPLQAARSVALDSQGLHLQPQLLRPDLGSGLSDASSAPPDRTQASTSDSLNLHNRPVRCAGIRLASIQRYIVSRATPRWAVTSSTDAQGSIGAPFVPDSFCMKRLLWHKAGQSGIDRDSSGHSPKGHDSSM